MKRFTATEKWGKEWFRSLPAKLKCFWQYLCDNVDGAGVWHPDFGLASFQIGETITRADVTALGDRIRTLPSGKIWIVGFIEFQCGVLREECNPHKKILQLLRKHGLLEEYLKGTQRVQEEDKEEEEEREKTEGVQREPIRGSAYPDELWNQPEFRREFATWEDHRSEVGKPISSKERQSTLSQCHRAGPTRSLVVIRHAISKGWKSLVWDFDAGGKGNGNGHSAPPKPPSPDPEHWREFLAEHGKVYESHSVSVVHRRNAFKEWLAARK